MRISPVRAGLFVIALAGLCACEPARSDGGLAALGDPPSTLPVAVTSYVELGRHYLKNNDLRLAKAAFIRSLRVEGVSAAALTGAGITAERQGLLREARRFFEQALKLAPSSEVAHNNLGAVQYRMGDYLAAKRSFRAAFAVSSGTNKVAEHNLGLAEMALKRQADREIPLVRNPVPLQREGTSEYRLLGAENKNEEEDG